jgi:WD40 repeat protein
VRLERVLEGKKPILAMAVSPDNRAVAVAQTGQVTVYERAGGTVPHVLTIVKGRITALQWDPRGEFLAIGRADGEIVLWRLKGSYRAGENRLEALETYRGATSPVVGIKFHPSSRLFFAAEESGAVTLWRLLRTEEEMGLRDTTAEADLGRESDRGRSVGKVPGRASDLWLSPDGALLFVSSGEGRVFSWRVRGLVPLGDFAASQEEVLSLTGLSTGVANQGADGSGMYFILTSSRGQRLELFCQNSPQPRQSVQPPPSRLSLAQSRILSKPASVVRSGGGVVWGGDREGNLLIVEERSVLSSPPVSQKIKQCSRQ